MAKPLGPKSLLIRQAITASPDLGNTALAAQINGSDARSKDKIKVTANDVAQQRQAMKKAGAALASAAAARPGAIPPRRKPGSKPRGKPAAAPGQIAARTAPAPATVGPVELIDRVFALADTCGGLEQLSRLVVRLVQARGA
jgi:hypothetical protein